jgi:hypothetical protein
VQALLRLDRPEEALSLAREGIQMAEEMDYLLLLWRLRAAVAQAQAMLGDADAAQREREAAAEIVLGLAEATPHPELRHAFLSDVLVSSILAASRPNP